MKMNGRTKWQAHNNAKSIFQRPPINISYQKIKQNTGNNKERKVDIGTNILPCCRVSAATHSLYKFVACAACRVSLILCKVAFFYLHSNVGNSYQQTE